MGIAITSGVLASLESRNPLHGGIHAKWESHTSGTSTPVVGPDVDYSLPSRFIACVKREETARKLQKTFSELPGLSGRTVEVVADQNVSSVQQSDVILLWCVPFDFPSRSRKT